MAVQSIPINLKNFFITNDPVAQINNALSQVLFNELSERNKLIRIISSQSSESIIEKNISKEFENKNYKLLFDEIEKKLINNTYNPNPEKFDLFI